MKISDIRLSIIPDSRGKDTLKVKFIYGKHQIVATVPSGKSKGKFETTSLDPVLCLKRFTDIKKEILAQDFSSLKEFDNFLIKLDGTENKSNLGGNLILVLSIGFTKLLAKLENLQTYELISNILGNKPNKFPYLFINLIEGGVHAENSLPFQEYLIVTKSGSPKKDLEYAQKVTGNVKGDVEKNFGRLRTTDEGAFAIKSDDPKVGLEVLSRNVGETNSGLSLDVAASTFYKNGSYQIGENVLSSDELLSLYEKLSHEFNLFSIEDPFAEEDLDGFVKITERLKEVLIVADDLTVTNPKLIKRAVDKKAATGVIIKPSQIGSVTETLQAIELAQNLDWKVIVSHRSAETVDDFIADLAYGARADGFKSGALTQAERLVKYNRLVEIETSL